MPFLPHKHFLCQYFNVTPYRFGQILPPHAISVNFNPYKITFGNLYPVCIHFFADFIRVTQKKVARTPFPTTFLT